MKLPAENDTLQAAKNIIMAIVEANVCEREGVFQTEQILARKLPAFRKSKGTIVSLENDNVYVKINLQLCESVNMMESVWLLQKDIKEEIIHLTGFNVKKIDVCIDKLILISKK